MSLLLLFNGVGGGGASYSLPIDTAAFTLSGSANNTLVGKRVFAQAQGFTLGGVSSGLVIGRKITANNATFSLNGVSASVLLGKKLLAAGGAFSSVGVALLLRKGFRLTGDFGTFTLNSPNVNIALGRLFGLDAGSFTLQGLDIVLRRQTFSPTPQSRIVDAILENRSTALENDLRGVSAGIQDRTIKTFSISRKVSTLLVNRIVKAE